MRNHIDIFSGLGGFSLACQANEIQTEVFCEADERRRQFLQATYPGIPVLPDVREFDGTKWRGRFILTAGTPCQPASRAGIQRGTEDDRWLWEEVIRIISEAKPRWVICENPPGIWDVAIDRIPFNVESSTVLRTEDQDSYRGVYSRKETLFVPDFQKRLEAMGYELAPPLEIGACAVNAPHLRQRVWIVAHSSKNDDRRSYANPSERQISKPGGDNGKGAVADTNRARPQAIRRQTQEQPRDELPDSQSHMADTAKIRRQSEQDARQRELCKKMEGEGQGRVESCDRGESELFWSRYNWTLCADGKFRRSIGDTQRMAHGLPVELLEELGTEGRQTPEDCEVHRSVLAALGDSIVWQVAAEVIRAIVVAEKEMNHGQAADNQRADRD